MRRGEGAASDTRPSIDDGYARMARRTCVLAVVVTVATFACTSKHVLTVRTERAVADQARLCAVALKSGPNGELWESVDRLRSKYRPLAAVATLGSYGDIEALYPDDSVFRVAAMATLDAGGLPTQTTVAVEGGRKHIWAASAPLTGSDSYAARHVLLMFTMGPHNNLWLSSTLTFALAMSIASFATYIYTTRWFRRRVVLPLRVLSHPAAVRNAPSVELPALECGGWLETGQIAVTLRTLSSEKRRIQQQTKMQLRDRTRGFDLQLRRAEDRAMTDCLTGLWNRAFLEAELEALFGKLRDQDKNFCAVMIDVDNFKHHNDTHGHQAGDDVLRFVGGILRASIRATDHAVRYGGDEFLLLLPDVDLDLAQDIAERIVILFRRYAATIDGSPHLSLSAGVASSEAMGCESGHALIAMADSALYATKRRGKNAVTVGCVD